MHLLNRIALLAFLPLLPLEAVATLQEEERAFAEEIANRHGFEQAWVEQQLEAAEHKEEIIAAITRPAEAMPWYRYRKIFMTEERIDGGVEFLEKHHDLLKQAESKYGVPAEIVTAIIGVETKYGKITGSHRVIDALKTLGFGYPKRGEFFRRQLEEFLLMMREEQMDPQQPLGSYAGAIGMPQFIPSSFRAFAIDFDGDGKRNLWDNPADVIGSVANYFAEHDWRQGEPVAFRLGVRLDGIEPGNRRGQKPNLGIDDLRALRATLLLPANLGESEQVALLEFEQPAGNDYWLGLHNFYVITRYNHSNLYAMAVYQLSEAIKQRLKDK
jgi:membrane-bound lytic murein transglycosylase B